MGIESKIIKRAGPNKSKQGGKTLKIVKRAYSLIRYLRVCVFLYIKSHISFDFAYSVSPSAWAGHKFFAVLEIESLHNSSTSNSGQF